MSGVHYSKKRRRVKNLLLLELVGVVLIFLLAHLSILGSYFRT